jgi:rhomboid family GlyGly-CTERM serine protease
MGRLTRSWDILLFSVVLLAASAPLALRGTPPLRFAYSPAAVGAGEWWRLLSHPFVHVSRYHLLLDGVAFVSLLVSLGDRRASDRILLVVASAAASLGTASLLPGETATYGLCGLSGVGHGLMAGAAVLTLREEGDHSSRRTAAIFLGVVVGKSLIEAATGRLLFDLVHLGNLGRPNPLCHLGGVGGGVLTALALPPLRGRGPGPRFGRAPRRDAESAVDEAAAGGVLDQLAHVVPERR